MTKSLGNHLRKMVVLTIIIFTACSDYENTENLNSAPIEASKTILDEDWLNEFNAEELQSILDEELNATDTFKHNGRLRPPRKTNETKVYVHYMSWFQDMETDGFWGQHWTMVNRNPDVVDIDGKREIASHFYPLIGTYSTKDPDLQQYHLQLMRMCGVDGVIFDWYGSRDVLDFQLIKEGMESMLDELHRTSMTFSVCYEDRVISEEARAYITPEQHEIAKNDIKYIEDNYFSHDHYIQCNNRDMLMVFGPQFVDEPADWDKIFSNLDSDPYVLSLWGSKELMGSHVSGEFVWVDEGHTRALEHYYSYYVNHEEEITAGAVYPGFKDYYSQGGWRAPEDEKWILEHNGMTRFQESLDVTSRYPVDFVQLVTWNDFGEGTMLEPSEEFGFEYLEKIQEYTGVRYRKRDLKVPYYIYKFRKQFKDDVVVQRLLNRAHRHANKRRMRRARAILCIIDYYFN